MEKTKFIWLNGKLVFWDDAKIHILTHTLHYGSGAFEGMRFYDSDNGSSIFRLKEHVGRLIRSFSIFHSNLPWTQEEIEKAIYDTVKANLPECKAGYIRPIVFHDYGIMGLNIRKESPVSMAIAVWPWGAYLGERPIKVKITNIRRLSPKAFKADAKICGHYVNSILATTEAYNAGFDEALMLDDKGNIAEGSGENIFAVKNSKLITPPLRGQILPGITRVSIIEVAKDLGYVVEERDVNVEELKDADEAFFTGTAAEVHPISQIDNEIIGDGKIGKITSKLKQTFSEIVAGKNKKYKKWLTYIK